VSVGILGTKLGMTQVFDEAGKAIPVTVVQAGPCTITQIKTAQTDGYTAIQVGFGAVAAKALNKPELGHLTKSEAPPLRHLHEYRLDSVADFQLGQQITADTFTSGQIVDVIGTSIVLKTIVFPVQRVQVLLLVVFIQVRGWRAAWAVAESQFAS
jgi:large subunit ribosomal protein L3